MGLGEHKGLRPAFRSEGDVGDTGIPLFGFDTR